MSGRELGFYELALAKSSSWHSAALILPKAFTGYKLDSVQVITDECECATQWWNVFIEIEWSRWKRYFHHLWIDISKDNVHMTKEPQKGILVMWS